MGSAAPMPAPPVPPPTCSDSRAYASTFSAYGRTVARKSHARTPSNKTSSTKTTRQPRQPCFFFSGSGASAFSSRGVAESRRSSSPCASSACVSLPCGSASLREISPFAGHFSSPHGASAGPTANDVAPSVLTANCSSCSPFTVTASPFASMLSGSSGNVESARTMSHSSPLPSVTATPSTSAISAPLFGPSTILRIKLMFVQPFDFSTFQPYNFSLPSGWMLISALSSWNERTGSS